MARKEWEYEDEEDEDDVSIKTLKAMILKQMGELNPLSEEFMILSKRLADITECERNETQTVQTVAQKWSWILPTAVQTLGTIVNTTVGFAMNRGTVRNVVDAEKDGYIIKSAATPMINKPRS